MPFAHALLPFAQAGGGGGGGGGEIAGIIAIVVAVIVVVAGLAINLMFLTTLKRLLEQCAPHNRLMEPGQVYLNLIPCFGAIWMFFTVSRVGQSLRNEFDERGNDLPGDYGQQLGITFAGLTLAWIIPYVGILFGLAGVICWIVYWVKMAEYNRHLSEEASYRDERDDHRRRRDEQRESDRRRRDYDDDEDDRPSRRRDDRDDRDDEEDDRPSRRRRYDD
jgi:hypothetical protein